VSGVGKSFGRQAEASTDAEESACESELVGLVGCLCYRLAVWLERGGEDLRGGRNEGA